MRSVRVAFISLLGLSLSHGAQIVVTTSQDELDEVSGAEVSLREALRDAADGDEIRFDVETLSGATILLSLGQLSIDRSVEIDASHLPEPVTIDGQQISRILRVLPAAEVVVRGVVISGGRASGEGGGVLNFGNLTLVDCEVSDNQSHDGQPGQPGSNGGGISSRQGSVVLRRCKILNNRSGRGGDGHVAGSGGSGGGIFCEGGLSVFDSIFSNNHAGHGDGEFGMPPTPGGTGGSGGGISCEGVLLVNNSIFSGNRAGDGSGVYSGLGADGGSGGAVYCIGTTTLENCHIHGNQAGAGDDVFNNGHPVFAGGGGPGGGVNLVTTSKTASLVRGCTIENNLTGLGGTGGGGERGDGGGIAHSGSAGLILENSTLYRNSAADPDCGLGIVQGYGGGLYSTGSPVIRNSTIIDNDAGFGGGIYVTHSSFELLNTIVAQNHICYTPASGTEIRGTLTKGCGHNFISGDPQLTTLGFYGGPTPTMPPLPGSPVIDAGMNTNEYSVDQRGFTRSINPGYDIGAVEFFDPEEFAEIWNSDQDGDGISYGVEQALGSDPFSVETPTVSLDYDIGPSGNQTLSFDLGDHALEGTQWIIQRSNDLNTFTEIYRFDGVEETLAEGVSTARDENRVQVNLQRAGADQAFYQFVSPLPGQ